MGSIVLYIMEWALALIVLLTIYKAAFSGTTLYRFNRFYLLGATLLEDLAELLDFGAELLDTTVELDRGMTLELDFTLLELDEGLDPSLLLRMTWLLDDCGTLELDRGADEELDSITLDELNLTTPKCAVNVVSCKIVTVRTGFVLVTSSSQ